MAAAADAIASGASPRFFAIAPTSSKLRPPCFDMTRAVADIACEILIRFSKRDRYSGSAKWRGHPYYTKGIAYAARLPAWRGRVLLLLCATLFANGFGLRAAVRPLQHIGHF